MAQLRRPRGWLNLFRPQRSRDAALAAASRKLPTPDFLWVSIFLENWGVGSFWFYVLPCAIFHA